MKRIFFSVLWFFFTGSLFVTTTSTIYLMRKKTKIEAFPSAISPVTLANTEARTGIVAGISDTIEYADSRVFIVEDFLKRHNSPLEPYEQYAQALVLVADTYKLDYRLLPAIMMQESNLCEKIPQGSYNCLGFGIHSRGTLVFQSYEQGFERAAKEIRANYIEEGLITPEMIMKKYAPSSNGSWAFAVNQFISEMEYNDKTIGKENQSDANLLEYIQQ